MKRKFLAIIPARAGSQRILSKNIRLFNGKPLIYYSIKQALASGLFDRVIVDTESEKIARLAKSYGAEVPFLRPAELAGNKSSIADVLVLLLGKLKKEQNYIPDVITLLEPTSPLRELTDIRACYEVMTDSTVKSVATVCQTSPWFFHLSPDNSLFLVNNKDMGSTNTQEVSKGYFLNGTVFMVRTDVFLKSKKSVYFHNGETVGIVCPQWRSIDINYPEDWALAEFVYKNKKLLSKAVDKVASQ